MSKPYHHTIDFNSPAFIKKMSALTRFLEAFFRFSIHGIEKIPANGAGILLMNHSAIPIDGMLLVSRFLKEKNRMIRPLVSPNMRKHFFLRESILLWGGVDANAKNALKLLKRGELILIYPGGPQEGIKDDSMRYKLIWEGEYGFVKLALLTGAPIIPAAAIGLDENFHLISQGGLLNKILFGPDAFLLPIVTPRRIVPKKVTLYIGDPIKFPYSKESVKDTKIVKQLHGQVKEVLENMVSKYVKET